MATVSLELFKQHVRADDLTGEDAVLEHYLQAAEESVVTATQRTEDELIGMGDGSNLPRPLVQAVLMLAAHWYNQRESVSTVQMHEVPDSLQSLVKPFRKLVDDAGGEDEH